MSKKINPGTNVGASGKISSGDIKADLRGGIQASKQRTSSGNAAMSLGVARVVTVNYEEFTVTLRVVLGEDQEFTRNPIALTFPGAGHRHFLGAMPEEGDYCVIGHLSQETDGRTSTPVILGWITPGTWMGHDWMVSQPFAPDEWSMDPKDSHFVAGQFKRVRHKLRHMEPGNVVASSSQGSDLVLNEEVLLTNRRGNEIRLRDNDQSIVIRALQEFSALGGTRTYSGMVQRDATFLPTSMFDRGVDWDGPRQINLEENRPYTNSELRSFGTERSFNQLVPNTVFDRFEDGSVGARNSGVFFEAALDPYDFLERGSYTLSGFAFDDKVRSDAVYGGKPYYRVSRQTDSAGNYLNAAIGNSLQARAYTEHRIELTHTWDGRLPVTDQTDDFDADRLPRTQGGVSSNRPFLESVMGTVVGNDPYTVEGRSKYGKPLKPRVFDFSGRPAPSFENAAGSPEGDQAATMFRLFPPTVNSGPATYTSFTKDGRFLAAIQGPLTKRYSTEIFSRSGIRVATGGVMRLEADGGLELNINNGSPENNFGLNLASNNGAVRIFGGGQRNEASAGKTSAPTGGGAADQPNVILEGRNNVEIKGSRRVFSNANRIESKANQISNEALSLIELNAGDRIKMTAKTMDRIVNGKMTTNIHGPKDNLPTNTPFRSTTISGLGIGTVDEYQLIQGDRSETLFLGNHTTSVLVGNLTYETLLGTFTARATPNQMTLDSASGMTTSVVAGNIQMDAFAGATNISGQVSVTIRSSGPTVVSGAAGITLGGPGKVGGIVSSSDLDPLTGAPLGTYGMGSPGHVLGPPV